LYVNPRGSTSYGGEFGNLIHHAYPGDDFYDLNSGVDVVLAKGYVDAENLFVTGGSGGGVLTCWMIDRTNRFRAAASLYPVINWESLLVRMPGEPHGLARRPSHHVAKILYVVGWFDQHATRPGGS